MRRYKTIDMASLPKEIREQVQKVDEYLKDVDDTLKVLNKNNVKQETSPSSGFFLLGWDSNGNLRRFDIGDLP